MKSIFWIFATVFLIISAAMIWIVKSGVTIRMQPLIKPTVVGENLYPMARHLFLRMFPDFQQTDFVLWSLDTSSSEAELFLSQMVQEYESQLKSVRYFDEAKNPIESCPSPCWAVSSTQEKLSEWKQKLTNSGKKWISISWKSYSNVESVSEECLTQKVLSQNCLLPVAVNDVKKKLKDPKARYFFLKKYLDSDFYLFVKTVDLK